MAKTLYISDLDGTLLDREGCLSEYTIQTIRRMIDSGIFFTVATARSLQAANDLIWYLGLRLPVVLTNGSAIYDSIGERYLWVKPLPSDRLPEMLHVVEKHGLCSFLHVLQDNRMTIYYRQIRHAYDEIYSAQRSERYHGRIYQTPDLTAVPGWSTPAYMVVCGPWSVLEAMQKELWRISGICSEIYCDVYNDFYFMDIFPATSSKVNGLLALKEMTGAEEMVAFGDSFNDMLMLLAADRAYVPKGAVIPIRNVATRVIDYAHRDGVAHFLAREFGWE